MLYCTNILKNFILHSLQNHPQKPSTTIYKNKYYHLYKKIKETKTQTNRNAYKHLTLNIFKLTQKTKPTKKKLTKLKTYLIDKNLTNLKKLIKILKKNYLLVLTSFKNILNLIKNNLTFTNKSLTTIENREDKNYVFLPLNHNYITTDKNSLKQIYSKHDLLVININLKINLFKSLILIKLNNKYNKHDDNTTTIIDNIIYIYNIINDITIKKIKKLETTLKDLNLNKKYTNALKTNVIETTTYKKIKNPQHLKIYKILLQEKNLNKYIFYNFLTKFIYGQNKNIKNIITTIKTKSVNKPLGSWLLCGSSGSGKTELAKILTAYLYRTETNLLRYDMSEFKEIHSISRLIGSPPGYIGHEDKDGIVEKIKQCPCSVILFDEIEKAHKNIFSLFLQILDEGILTNSKGETSNFNQTIILFTSNLGSDILKSFTGYSFISSVYRNSIISALNKFLKPEFLNRLNDVLIFNPVTLHSLYNLIEKQIFNFKNFDLSSKVKAFLSCLSYSPLKGSRFILNNIDKIIQTDSNVKVNLSRHNKKFTYIF
ncbi:Clpb protein, putative (apicoplast) [Theileria equi strain WA]|uniref:Clpb protein, putative n=1 Tax=Theileria equi strain WA TaxID=1537102 RepID=L1L8Y3_THEEQ|nr:Clpb protein, putative [Theileria equi strain WA]EKX71966.1 Clpb protein, putative [Theileria equi strain WA]|eukprot:XP_025033559.1 Clpb protein, putative (apicoplast) [Theileria equi strain WA]